MTEYRTVSIPRPLAEAVDRFMGEVGYWPSLSSFVREACHEKLHRERMKQKAIKKEDEG